MDAPTTERVRVDEVVLALDGTIQAPRAVPLAQQMIEAFKVRLTVVAVSREHDHTVEALNQLQVAGLNLRAPWVRQDQLIGSNPAAALAAFTASLGDALLCLATHGRDHVVGSPLGDFASELLQESELPVVLIGPAARVENKGSVLACVDGSSDSERILPAALLFARALRRPLEVICVVESVPDSLDDRPTRRVFGPDGDPQGYVARLVDRLVTKDVAVTSSVLADPIGPFEGLSYFLRDNPAVLVAVASHPREGLTPLLHRSLTALLVDRASCPVLALPLHRDN